MYVCMDGRRNCRYCTRIRTLSMVLRRASL